ncbi:RING-H2 finger protein ATL39-like [Quercus robur]|uniref:RING-H2 finger protein ATL39-like n=1 Tax=Quercus robur TaxID=38942 RepID=UPI0021636425|nr:RING-H2 finger protein ATL39-like [Quercus robur]
MEPCQNNIAFDHNAPCPRPDSYNNESGILVFAFIMLVLFYWYVCHVWLIIRRIFPETQSTDDHGHGRLNRLPANSSEGQDPTAKRAGRGEGLDLYANLYQIDSCAICLTEFEENNGEDEAEAMKVKVIPFCKHVFHPDCLDTWLSAHSTCPICGSKIDDQGVNKEKIMCEGEYQLSMQGVMSTTKSSSGDQTYMTMTVGNVHDHVCIEIHDHI